MNKFELKLAIENARSNGQRMPNLELVDMLDKLGKVLKERRMERRSRIEEDDLETTYQYLTNILARRTVEQIRTASDGTTPSTVRAINDTPDPIISTTDKGLWNALRKQVGFSKYFDK